MESCRWGNLVFRVTGKKIEQQKNGKSRGFLCRIAHCFVRDSIEKMKVSENYEAK